MARSTFVYVTYIRTTPEKLWSALTDAEFMKQYWFGNHSESQWTAGSSWKNVSGDGQITDAGEIVEAEPPRRLVIRWQPSFCRSNTPLRAPALDRTNHGKGHFWKPFVGSSSAEGPGQHS